MWGSLSGDCDCICKVLEWADPRAEVPHLNVLTKCDLLGDMYSEIEQQDEEDYEFSKLGR